MELASEALGPQRHVMGRTIWMKWYANDERLRLPFFQNFSNGDKALIRRGKSEGLQDLSTLREAVAHSYTRALFSKIKSQKGLLLRRNAAAIAL